MGTEFQLWKMKNVLGTDGADGHLTMGMYLTPQNCMLKNG